MTVEQIVAIISGLNTFVCIGVFIRLGAIGQEIRDHKINHETVLEDIKKIQQHCPLCTER